MSRTLGTTSEAQRAPGRGPSQLEGEVIANAADDASLIKVRVFNPDGPAQSYGPMRWTAPNAHVPFAGDPALIVQAHNTREWFAQVWPAESEQP